MAGVAIVARPSRRGTDADSHNVREQIASVIASDANGPRFPALV